ncbi:amino acid permease [Penicillium herquei]|nr:amino acid permease [Penicillium herquei]
MAFLWEGTVQCILQLAEEAERATTILGPTMIISIVIDGLLGFGMVMALLFNKQTFQEISSGIPYWPEMLFYETTRSRAATIIMSCVWIVPFMGAVLASIGPASRQIWSLSRDQGIPGWRIWKKVSKISSSSQDHIRSSSPFIT